MASKDDDDLLDEELSEAPDVVVVVVDWRDLLLLCLSLLPADVTGVLFVEAEIEFGMSGEFETFGKLPANPGKLLLICFINSFMPGMFSNPPREFRLPNWLPSPRDAAVLARDAGKDVGLVEVGIWLVDVVLEVA